MPQKPISQIRLAVFAFLGVSLNFFSALGAFFYLNWCCLRFHFFILNHYLISLEKSRTADLKLSSDFLSGNAFCNRMPGLYPSSSCSFFHFFKNGNFENVS